MKTSIKITIAFIFSIVLLVCGYFITKHHVIESATPLLEERAEYQKQLDSAVDFQIKLLADKSCEGGIISYEQAKKEFPEIASNIYKLNMERELEIKTLNSLINSFPFFLRNTLIDIYEEICYNKEIELSYIYAN